MKKNPFSTHLLKAPDFLLCLNSQNIVCICHQMHRALKNLEYIGSFSGLTLNDTCYNSFYIHTFFLAHSMIQLSVCCRFLTVSSLIFFSSFRMKSIHKTIECDFQSTHNISIDSYCVCTFWMISFCSSECN